MPQIGDSNFSGNHLFGSVIPRILATLECLSLGWYLYVLFGFFKSGLLGVSSSLMSLCIIIFYLAIIVGLLRRPKIGLWVYYPFLPVRWLIIGNILTFNWLGIWLGGPVILVLEFIRLCTNVLCHIKSSDENPAISRQEAID